MHSSKEGAFFVFCGCNFTANRGCFGAKIAHLQCGCQLVGQNSVFLTHVLRFLRVFHQKNRRKSSAKMLTKCVCNHAKPKQIL